MPLEVTVAQKESGVFIVSPCGSIDSESCWNLEKAVNPILVASTKALIFNMEGVDFISSMGLSVIFKIKQKIEDNKGTLIITNLQPQIKKVFDAVKIISSSLFASLEEADEYLDAFLSDIEKKK